MSVEKRIAEMERLRREATPGEWRHVSDEFTDSVRGEQQEPYMYSPVAEDVSGESNSVHIVAMQNSQEALLRIARAAAAYVNRDVPGREFRDLCEALDAFASFHTEAKDCQKRNSDKVRCANFEDHEGPCNFDPPWPSEPTEAKR